MSKLIRILVLLLFCSIQATCVSNKKTITINQKEAKNSVVVRLTNRDGIVFGVKIPNKIEIKNETMSKRSFIKVNYHYQDSLTKWRNLGIELYETNAERTKRIRNNLKRDIQSKEMTTFLLYTRHFIDSSKTTQEQFTPYIKRMLAENKDTLHIGTVTEFKKKHKALFEKLTKGDSISVQFLEGKKLGERITVPVEW